MPRRFSSASALALIAVLGCAHAPERPPATATATPAAPAPEPTAQGGVAAAGAAPSETGAAPPPAAPPRLDPSEEITPEELASIPDPVPDTSPAPIEASPLAPGADSAATGGGSGSGGSAAGAAAAAGSTAASGVWRVQVFASPDRAQAERVGREASDRLGVPYVLERDQELVKVRLGSYAREEEAQALKERAVRNGYPGAFRVLDRGGS